MNADQHLVESLRAAAQATNHSPEALIKLGQATAQWHNQVVLQAHPPWPTTVDVEEITAEQLDLWPAWVAELVQPGSRWERLEWESGAYTVRLLTPYRRVLAGSHFPAG